MENKEIKKSKSNSDKKSINELYGIIKGIDADNIINQEEIKFLQEWLINNKNYENSESIGDIYNSLKNILEDNRISQKEKEDLLKMCESIEQRFLDKKECYFASPTPVNFNKPKRKIPAELNVFTPDGVYKTKVTFIDCNMSLREVIYEVSLPKAWDYI